MIITITLDMAEVMEIVKEAVSKRYKVSDDPWFHNLHDPIPKTELDQFLVSMDVEELNGEKDG